MSWTNRVIWQEGMFLRAQHFQQQDRWLEAQVRGRTGDAAPVPVGHDRVTPSTATCSRPAVSRCPAAAGVFEDGTLFVIPGETDHPAPLEAPPDHPQRGGLPCPPIRQAGAVEVGLEEDQRRPLRAEELRGLRYAFRIPATGRTTGWAAKLRYMLETQDRAGYHCIGLARITEVAADRRITLDDRWIPPSLVCSAAPPLSGLLAELTGMLNQRGEALAGRLSAPGARGVAEVADFLLLQSVNRWQKLLSHWADSGNVHPEDLYATLVQMVGEFATFTETTRRPNSYPAYRHEDLQRSFAPVVADLRRSLSAVLETTAVSIPLQERRHGVRVGPLTDRSILRNSNFVLSVQADVPGENLRRLFPAQVKIGAVEHIRELVNVALPGISVRPLRRGAAADPVLRGGDLFRARPQQSALAADAVIGRLRHSCVGRISRTEDGALGYSRQRGRLSDAERQSVCRARTIRTGHKSSVRCPGGQQRDRPPHGRTAADRRPPARGRRCPDPPRWCVPAARRCWPRRASAAIAVAVAQHPVATGSGRIAGTRRRRDAPVRAGFARNRRADGAVASGALRAVRQPGRCGAGDSLGQPGGLGLAIAGVDISPGSPQRRPVFRRAEPGETKSRHVPAGAGTDVSVPVARVSRAAIGCRRAGRRNWIGCGRRSTASSPANVRDRTRTCRRIGAACGALSRGSRGGAGMGRRCGRSVGGLRRVCVDIVRVERGLGWFVRPDDGGSTGTDAGNRSRRAGAAARAARRHRRNRARWTSCAGSCGRKSRRGWLP